MYIVSATSTIQALSFTLLSPTATKMTRKKIAPTNEGNGNLTSPARYEAAVADVTTEVVVKSNSRREAPNVDKYFEETFRRYV
jgi:hypothetical protein